MTDMWVMDSCHLDTAQDMKIAAMLAEHGSCGWPREDNSSGYTENRIDAVADMISKDGIETVQARLTAIHDLDMESWLTMLYWEHVYDTYGKKTTRALIHAVEISGSDISMFKRRVIKVFGGDRRRILHFNQFLEQDKTIDVAFIEEVQKQVPEEEDEKQVPEEEDEKQVPDVPVTKLVTPTNKKKKKKNIQHARKGDAYITRQVVVEMLTASRVAEAETQLMLMKKFAKCCAACTGKHQKHTCLKTTKRQRVL